MRISLLQPANAVAHRGRGFAQSALQWQRMIQIGTHSFKISAPATDTVPMPTSQYRKRALHNPGLRALNACGDGFWEFALVDGTVWFSDWFYRKLGWPSDTQRTTLEDLKPLTPQAQWDALMRGFRDHLEQRLPLDVRLQVRVPGDRIEWWHIRGSAERNDAGQPTLLAGSAREIPDAGRGESWAMRRTCGAFDALPVAAVLLDTKGNVLKVNRQCSESFLEVLPALLARVKATAIPVAVDFPWELEVGPEGTPRRLRVRAVPVEQQEHIGWVAMIEDRAAPWPTPV